jgi:hypothetical protein
MTNSYAGIVGLYKPFVRTHDVYVLWNKWPVPVNILFLLILSDDFLVWTLEFYQYDCGGRWHISHPEKILNTFISITSPFDPTMSDSRPLIFLGCSDNEKTRDFDIFLSCLLFYVLATQLKITGSLGDFKVSLVRAIFGPLRNSKLKTLEQDNSNISARVDRSTYVSPLKRLKHTHHTMIFGLIMYFVIPHRVSDRRKPPLDDAACVCAHASSRLIWSLKHPLET